MECATFYVLQVTVVNFEFDKFQLLDKHYICISKASCWPICKVGTLQLSTNSAIPHFNNTTCGGASRCLITFLKCNLNSCIRAAWSESAGCIHALLFVCCLPMFECCVGAGVCRCLCSVSLLVFFNVCAYVLHGVLYVVLCCAYARDFMISGLMCLRRFSLGDDLRRSCFKSSYVSFSDLMFGWSCIGWKRIVLVVVVVVVVVFGVVGRPKFAEVEVGTFFILSHPDGFALLSLGFGLWSLAFGLWPFGLLSLVVDL